MDPSGNVYVADTNNSRIQVFDSTGKFSSKWGSAGSEPGQFRFAVGVDTDSRGNVYVTETHPNNRIQVFGEPAPTIPDLVESVAAMELPQGTANSLLAKLASAERSLARNQLTPTTNKLGALIAELEAQSGKKLAAGAATELIADVREIVSSLGCLGES